MAPILASEAAALLAIPGQFLGPDAPRRLVVIDEPTNTGATAALVGFADRPTIVIAIGESDAPWADVVVASEDAAARVCHAIDSSPNAALVLCQQLRLGELLPPGQALIAESLAYSTLQGGSEFGRWLATQGRRVRPRFSEPAVLVDDAGSVVTLTLNRPRLRNALTAEIRDEWAAALRVLATRPDVAIIVRGAGKAFCVGGDLAEFGTTLDGAEAHRIRQHANVAPAMAAVSHQCTVELQGPCVGAGVELAAFAGHVIASPDTTLSLPEVQMGLIPGAGGTVSIPRRVGRHAAAHLMLTGDTIDAETALALGLIDAIDR